MARREEIIKRQDEAIRSLEVKDFIPTRQSYNHSSFEKMISVRYTAWNCFCRIHTVMTKIYQCDIHHSIPSVGVKFNALILSTNCQPFRFI